MKATLRQLYEGDGPGARAFRTALLVFDVVTIGYFLLTASGTYDASTIVADLGIAAVILADLVARWWLSTRRLAFAVSFTTLTDLAVLVSLLVPLVAGTNLGFLRALRMLRLARSFRIAERIETVVRGRVAHTRIVVAAANLVAFIFVVTSIVWVLEHARNDAINTYVDALYFTITTLTTTGFGDITLTGRGGRLLTVGIMIFGVGFFLNLLQAIYRPAKVEQPCWHCGLRLHDHDASHCKHCGSVIYIETEGDT